MSPQQIRSVRAGENRRIGYTVVEYTESADLSALPVRFWMRKTGSVVPEAKVQGAEASALDATPEGQTPMTVWHLYYDPTPEDVDTPGDYLGEFEVEFAPTQKRYYPDDRLLIPIIRTLA